MSFGIHPLAIWGHREDDATNVFLYLGIAQQTIEDSDDEEDE